MTRTRLAIAGGALLVGAAFAGVLFGRVHIARAQDSAAARSSQNPQAAPLPWNFPLPEVKGPGYVQLDSLRPNGPWAPLGNVRLRGPQQPVFYRHDVHAGQYRIPCLYCHNNAANSWTAMIPTVSTCIGCHNIITAADSAGNPNPEIARLKAYADSARVIPWVRVFKIAEHAHFPHMRHVNAGLQCQECHGNIQQMPRVFAANDVNQMGWCTNCHMRRGITRDCTVCHF